MKEKKVEYQQKDFENLRKYDFKSEIFGNDVFLSI